MFKYPEYYQYANLRSSDIPDVENGILYHTNPCDPFVLHDKCMDEVQFPVKKQSLSMKHS